jgi:hypothetical protein
MNCINNNERHPHKFFKVSGMVFIGIVTAIAFAFVFGYVVELLWNWLMPEIFGLKTITYWQGFGIVILCKIIFGGFGQFHKHHHGRHFDEHHRPWRKFKQYKRNGCWSHSEWSYFEKFWDEEGKTAFENYIKRMESNEKKQ